MVPHEKRPLAHRNEPSGKQMYRFKFKISFHSIRTITYIDIKSIIHSLLCLFYLSVGFIGAIDNDNNRWKRALIQFFSLDKISFHDFSCYLIGGC